MYCIFLFLSGTLFIPVHVHCVTHRPSYHGLVSRCLELVVKFCLSGFDKFAILGYWGTSGWQGYVSIFTSLIIASVL